MKEHTKMVSQKKVKNVISSVVKKKAVNSELVMIQSTDDDEPLSAFDLAVKPNEK